MKAESYTCEDCNVKQSRAKGKEVYVECHHREKDIDWDKIIDYIMEELLVSPDKLQVLCKNCHQEIHKNDKNKGH